LSACPTVNAAMNQTWIESLGLNFSQCPVPHSRKDQRPEEMILWPLLSCY
jgi:hypothetical protein